MTRLLGRRWRWLPCHICGASSSERVEYDTGAGTRVFCVNVDACDARAASRRADEFR